MSQATSSICIHCRMDWPSRPTAERLEADWRENPVEIKERKCSHCKRRYPWFWFLKST